MEFKKWLTDIKKLKGAELHVASIYNTRHYSEYLESEHNNQDMVLILDELSQWKI